MESAALDAEEFREVGKRMVDLVADYWDSLRDRKPLHDVKPGYIWDMLPKEAPDKPEEWDKVFGDIEKVVFDANTHWHHPHFFAYYPTACSYPALIADILAGGISSVGFTWNSSPACTELEMSMMDWLAKLLKLPDHFLNSDPGFGAGMIQGTASEATYVAMLAAKKRAYKRHKETSINTEFNFFRNWSRIAFNRIYNYLRRDESDSTEIISYPQLVAYCSDQAHSSVEKGGLMGMVTVHQIKTLQRDNYAMKRNQLEEAIKEDLAQGLTPFFVVATVGTTSCCAMDDLKSLGPVCQQYALWLHVDAAYAGSAAICPEYRHYIDGVEMADSFNFNPHKWLMVNFDCSAMWFRDTREVDEAFLEQSEYLKHDHQRAAVPDYKLWQVFCSQKPILPLQNWQIPLGRRFRSLKIWFVLRTIGVNGLQENIRKQCALAKEFGKLVGLDKRFELVMPCTLGLVCFRLKGENSLTERLLKSINMDRRIHLVAAKVQDTYFLRLAVCSTKTNSSDIGFAWSVIQELTKSIA